MPKVTFRFAESALKDLGSHKRWYIEQGAVSEWKRLGPGVIFRRLPSAKASLPSLNSPTFAFVRQTDVLMAFSSQALFITSVLNDACEP